MSLRTDDCQSSSVFHFLRKLDVGTTASHVGSDGDSLAETSLGHDVGLVLMKLCVEYIVRNMSHREHL